LRVKK